MHRRHFRLVALAIVTFGLVGAPTPNTTGSSEQFDKTVKPLIAKRCFACHNSALKSGDLDLGQFKTAESVANDPEVWEKVSHRLLDGTMPPKGSPRPSQTDIEAVSRWIADEVKRIELASKPDPGKVTARRLNRAEYNNTVRDLLGVNFRPADDFPQDDSGYGFDNIGDVLSLSPVLLEKYLKAAEVVVRTAMFGPEKLKPMALRSQPPGREFTLVP